MSGPAKRHVPPGSRQEAEMAQSMIYGILHTMLLMSGSVINENFNFLGAELHKAEGSGPGVIFDGLTVHMASGAYGVTVERTES